MLRILGITGGVVLVCLAVFALYILGYIHWRPPNFAVLASRNPQKSLAQADYLASLDNWEAARPYFAKAESLFASRGDQRDALYARISCVEADVEKGSYAQTAQYLDAQALNPLVQNDPRLKLRWLTVKEIVDFNTNTFTAEHDWTEALHVAKSLHDVTWQNRATGWLGVLSFVNGDGSNAGKKVIGALLQCALHHDIGGRSIVFLGKDATEQKLKTEPLQDSEILHFAVHRVVNTAEPDRSALLFADGPHSTEDGLWQAREIRTLSLKAELVTLSACDTGIGKIEGEEGVDSLVGAFLMAGAKNVIASLWPTSDRYTATLMEDFYSHLARGMDIPTALNRAELDILHRYGRQTAPFYWAPFEVIGAGAGHVALHTGTLNAALKN